MLSNAIYKGTITNGTEHTFAHMMIVTPSLGRKRPRLTHPLR